MAKALYHTRPASPCSISHQGMLRPGQCLARRRMSEAQAGLSLLSYGCAGLQLAVHAFLKLPLRFLLRLRGTECPLEAPHRPIPKNAGQAVCIGALESICCSLPPSAAWRSPSFQHRLPAWQGSTPPLPGSSLALIWRPAQLLSDAPGPASAPRAALLISKVCIRACHVIIAYLTPCIMSFNPMTLCTHLLEQPG